MGLHYQTYKSTSGGASTGRNPNIRQTLRVHAQDAAGRPAVARDRFSDDRRRLMRFSRLMVVDAGRGRDLVVRLTKTTTSQKAAAETRL